MPIFLHMWRTLLTAAAAVAAAAGLAGCAGPTSAPDPGPTATATATRALAAVTGVVAAVPGCPGPVRQDSPCPARPVPGARVDAVQSGRAVATVNTDASGRFTLHLIPGTYRLVARNAGPFPSQAERIVVVSGDTTVEMLVDSGLR
jgi:hypothetical protein